ncbi:MAG: hypothetical protein IPJ18_21125 [Betaproteobacteria bacterium]|nr:hypothetical protein [Betaproteobacteria bacterium]
MTQFSDLLHMVYAASAEPARWHEAVAGIAKAMNAASCCSRLTSAPPTAASFTLGVFKKETWFFTVPSTSTTTCGQKVHSEKG